MSNSKSRRPRRGTLAAAVERARERIEHWRATREKRTRMPEPLWQAAAAAAREHGLWAVSRALRVSYESLKKRVEQPLPVRRPAAASFVELDTSHLVGPPTSSATTVIELSDVDGAKMTVRLEGRDAPDVAALVCAFWGRDR